MNARRIALAAGVAGAAYVLARRRIRTWGALDREACAPMPGDELIPYPSYESTRAVLICAEPADVWPWLVQMSQGHTVDRIIPRFQHLAAGDVVRVAPDAGMLVSEIEPEHTLVLRALADVEARRLPDPRDPRSADWTWVCVLHELGPDTTRLLVRVRADMPAGPRSLLAGALLWEPAHFVIERKMLLAIKRRAERTVRLSSELDEIGQSIEGWFRLAVPVTPP